MEEQILQGLLERARTIAVVGMSRNPWKTAYQVPASLAGMGYTIIPVNPSTDIIMGQRCYPDLTAIPDRVDIVEVFRPSADALAVVEQAVARRAARGDVTLIWLQSGIVSEAGRRLAEAAGIPFVQNRCMAVDAPRLLPAGVLDKTERE